MQKKLLSEEQLKILRENITYMTYRDQQAFVKERFGIDLTLEQCKYIRNNYRIFSKLTGCFQKGDVPHNKGKKMWKDGCPESVKRTQFKRGHIPHNARPIGYECIGKDGYIKIKVEGERKLVHKHRWVWEQVHGKIPKGNIVIFLNGDKTDCRIENLKLISRKLNATRNKYGLLFKGKESNETALLVAELIQKRSELRKKNR